MLIKLSPVLCVKFLLPHLDLKCSLFVTKNGVSVDWHLEERSSFLGTNCGFSRGVFHTDSTTRLSSLLTWNRVLWHTSLVRYQVVNGLPMTTLLLVLLKGSGWGWCTWGHVRCCRCRGNQCLLRQKLAPGAKSVWTAPLQAPELMSGKLPFFPPHSVIRRPNYVV